MAFQSIHNRIVVKPTEAVRSDGLARGVAYSTGRVVMHAPLCRLHLDDRVLYAEGSGTPVEIDGEPLVVLREDEIVGVFD